MAGSHLDVLIVGAGPAGLSLVCECLRHGANARIIDKRPALSGKSKALAIWSSALEALAAMGCADAILETGNRVDRIRITASGRPVTMLDAHEGVNSVFPNPILLPQSETERILANHFTVQAGKIERGVSLISFSQTDTCVASVLRHPDGKEETVTSRWLVGCDGAHSTVRNGLGVDFEGAALEETFVLCDAEIDQELDPAEVIIDWSRKGVFALFPIADGLWRIVASRAADDERTGDPTLEEMHEHVASHGRPDWQLSNPSWLASFRISDRKVKEYRHGRVLLAGDAAHIHSPAGGQGMNTGIQDAFNLGWKLGLLAAGRGDEEALLDSYHEERSPVATKILKEAAARTKVSLLKNPFTHLVRNTIVRIAGTTEGFQTAFARNLSGLDIGYAASPILDDDTSWHEDWRSDGFEPGYRVRDAGVFCPKRKQTVPLYFEVTGGPHCLLFFSGRRPDEDEAAQIGKFEQDAREIAGETIRVVRVWRGDEAPEGTDWLLDEDGDAHTIYGADQCGAYLVRPDGYVALRCSPLDSSLFAGYAQLVLCKVGEPVVETEKDLRNRHR